MVMKAQVSFDIILAVAVAFIALSATMVISQDIAQTQTKNSIKDQLRARGTGLATAISLSAIFNDADNATIEYTPKKIIVPGETKPEECTISISGTDLKLDYELFDTETGTSETITQNIPFVKPQGMALNPSLGAGDELKCGQKLTITKT